MINHVGFWLGVGKILGTMCMYLIVLLIGLAVLSLILHGISRITGYSAKLGAKK